MIEKSVKQDEDQTQSLKKAIGLLNNRIVILERLNRSLDAIVRRLDNRSRLAEGLVNRLSNDIQQLKTTLYEGGRGR